MKILIDTIKAFVKKETVLVIAWLLAIVSCFFVFPDKEYIDYIDFRSLGILWSLMIVMQGFQTNDVFAEIGGKLLKKTKKIWQLAMVLILLCFFSSMFITNDVALITFVPFAILMLENCERRDLIIPVVVLQTMAANLGSMLTPVGNPQNLYLYGLSNMSIWEFLLWMLPYTAMSLILIMISICFLKGKSQPVTGLKNNDNNSLKSTLGQTDTKNKENDNKENADKKISNKSGALGSRNLRVIIFGILFILALLVVLKLIDYYIVVAIVLVAVFIVERKVLVQIDYALLFTFIGFFIFTGNLGRVDSIREFLSSMIQGQEILIAVVASQGISNVPAALLLSGFTDQFKLLLLGVDLGGLGTLIASMASLISYKTVAHRYNEIKGKYLLWFTVVGIIFLVVLMAEAYLLVH